MVKVKKDLTGMTFGRLTVKKQVEDYISKNGRHYARWLCECSCDEHNEIIVCGSNLTGKRPVKSCGCLIEEIRSEIGKRNCTFDLNSAEYGIGYTMKGDEFWFDKEDYDLIKNYCWNYDAQGYVVAKERGTGRDIKLHRLVLNVTDPDVKVDHKKHPPRNEHKKDNRKLNLDIVTTSQNNMNVSLRIDNKSGVAGVFWNKDRQKWQAQIRVNKQLVYLGLFINKEDAIKARKDAEIKYFGDHRYDANN